MSELLPADDGTKLTILIVIGSIIMLASLALVWLLCTLTSVLRALQSANTAVSSGLSSLRKLPSSVSWVSGLFGKSDADEAPEEQGAEESKPSLMTKANGIFKRSTTDSKDIQVEPRPDTRSRPPAATVV